MAQESKSTDKAIQDIQEGEYYLHNLTRKRLKGFLWGKDYYVYDATSWGFPGFWIYMPPQLGNSDLYDEDLKHIGVLHFRSGKDPEFVPDTMRKELDLKKARALYKDHQAYLKSIKKIETAVIKDKDTLKILKVAAAAAKTLKKIRAEDKKKKAAQKKAVKEKIKVAKKEKKKPVLTPEEEYIVGIFPETTQEQVTQKWQEEDPSWIQYV